MSPESSVNMKSSDRTNKLKSFAKHQDTNVEKSVVVLQMYCLYNLQFFFAPAHRKNNYFIICFSLCFFFLSHFKFLSPLSLILICLHVKTVLQRRIYTIFCFVWRHTRQYRQQAKCGVIHSN